MTIEENASLAPLTTFGLGGKARFLVRTRTIKEIAEALAFCNAKKLKHVVLGGGSNTLFSDTSFDGVVIKIECHGLHREGNTIIAMAGERWDDLVRCAVQHDLWGLENLSGIPGHVGGAVVQNIGAYGMVASETLAWVRVYDTTHKEMQTLTGSECRFGYRDSIFKHEPGRYIVWQVAFVLSAEAKTNLSYRDVEERMRGSALTLNGIREAIVDIRRGKFPDLSQEGTAGSFFKNPIFSSQEAEALQKKYPTIPLFSIPDSAGVKVPLAWFLDTVLHLKGFAVGGARVFEKQPLVLVASRDATASDVLLLAQKIKEVVQENIHIEIENEVQIIS